MVAADNVFAADLEARKTFGHFARCQIGNLRFDPEDRIIARSDSLDIATFLIAENEIGRAGDGRFPMSFNPMMPQTGKGVFFAGFPGVARRRLSSVSSKTVFSRL